MSAKIIVHPEEMASIQENLAKELIIRHPDGIALIGVQRRGFDLARRLAKIIRKNYGITIPIGAIDINLHRDDWPIIAGKAPAICQTDIPFNLDGKQATLVDDVMFTGRTARAALEALLDYGRPSRVELLVFIDRGHREMPICPDYTGKTIPSARNERIDVLFSERDGQDAVMLI